MAHVTAEEEAALNEVMQMLEAQPLATTSSAAVVPLDDRIPAQREKLAVLVSKPSACSSHMIRLNAFQTRMFQNALKGMTPTSATRPLIL